MSATNQAIPPEQQLAATRQQARVAGLMDKLASIRPQYLPKTEEDMQRLLAVADFVEEKQAEEDAQPNPVLKAAAEAISGHAQPAATIDESTVLAVGNHLLQTAPGLRELAASLVG